MKRQKNRPDLPTSVFVFGCTTKPSEGDGLNSFLLLNQCYNDIIDARRKVKDAYFTFMSKLDPRLEKIGTALTGLYAEKDVLRDEIRALKVAKQTRKVTDRGAVDQIETIDSRIDELKKERAAIWKRLKVNHKEEIKSIFDAEKPEIASIKAKYASRGCNGLAIDAIIEEAKQSKNLRFRAFRDGKSKLTKRFTTGKPLTFGEILNGKWTQMKIVSCEPRLQENGRARPGNMLTVDFNIGEGFKYNYLRLAVTQHRDIPADALVVRAVLKTVRRGSRLKYELNLTLEHPTAFTKPVSGTGVVSMDFNYRRKDGGLELVTWIGDDGRYGTVAIDSTFLSGREKVDDLQSIRDTNLNQIKDVLSDFDKALLPEWLREFIQHIHAWKSPRKVFQLYTEWKTGRFYGDESLFARLEGWVIDERHLEQYQFGLNRRLQAARLSFQRNFAASLRKMGYATVLGDGIGLKKLGTKKPVEFADDSLNAVRWNKNLACHSQLTTALKQSGMTYIKTDCTNTSRRCTACGHVGKKSTDQVLACKCGHTEHRDLRGALNPLQVHTGRRIVPSQQMQPLVLTFSEHRRNKEEHRERYLKRHPEARLKMEERDERRTEQMAFRDQRRSVKAAKRPVLA